MKLTAQWLKNNGLRIRQLNGKGRLVASRFAGPEDLLSRREAAVALGTYYELIRSMVEEGKIRTVAPKATGGYALYRIVPMAEVLRLRRAWKITGRPTRLISTPTRGR